MANHMAEVAKMLGVELGEEFKIVCKWLLFFLLILMDALLKKNGLMIA